MSTQSRDNEASAATDCYPSRVGTDECPNIGSGSCDGSAVTLVDMEPPRWPPRIATGYDFPDDDVAEIGDRIAALSADDAQRLGEYLKTWMQ